MVFEPALGAERERVWEDGGVGVKQVGGLCDGGPARDGPLRVLEVFLRGDAGLARGDAVRDAEALIDDGSLVARSVAALPPS